MQQMTSTNPANAPLQDRATSMSSRRNQLFRRENALGLVSAGITLLILLVALTAGIISPYDPNNPDLMNTMKPPSLAHLLGTDDLGRDILSRVLYGTRVSLTVGVTSVLIGGSVGTVLGLLSGFYRWLDGIIMRIIDILLAFPGIILALAIVAALGASEVNVVIATAIFSVPGFARLVRSTTLAAKNELYVEASRISGASDSRILFRVILPNIQSPIIVQSTIRVGASILASSGLSYLGLGTQPPTPDWGAMVSEGQVNIWNAPWISLFPGLAIFITVIGVNLFGDWLRDRSDTRTRG